MEMKGEKPTKEYFININTRDLIVDINKIENSEYLSEEGSVPYGHQLRSYDCAVTSPNKDTFQYCKLGEIIVKRHKAYILRIVSNYSNCQLATVEDFDNFLSYYPNKKEGIEKLAKLLKSVGSTHFFFHVTKSYVKYIEHLVKEDKDLEIVYNQEVETYYSRQHHILVRCNFKRNKERLV